MIVRRRGFAMLSIALSFIAPRLALGDIEATGMFDTSELSVAHQVKAPAARKIAASDGVMLAYYPFLAQAPVAKLVFYHGGGAHSLAGYQYFAQALSEKQRVSTYLVDIRGHGQSGGERGDAPGAEQVWQDVSTVIAAVRAQAPQAPLFLGAHSSGAGLLLNYLDAHGVDFIDGFAFIAPEFGYRADVKRKTENRFAYVSYPAFIINSLSAGYVCGHCQAVRFNYSQETITKGGFLAGYTVNMSKAVTPHSPSEQLARLKGRLGVWVGTEDELFDPDKLKLFIQAAVSPDLAIQFQPIPRAKHLSILVNVDAPVGEWIGKIVR